MGWAFSYCGSGGYRFNPGWSPTHPPDRLDGATISAQLDAERRHHDHLAEALAFLTPPPRLGL
jgi:hypothetical protein